MSIIGCQVTEDKIIVGSDCSMNYGQSQTISRPGQKLFHTKDIIIGCAGYLEEANLARLFFETTEIEIPYTTTTLTSLAPTVIYSKFFEMCEEMGVTMRDETETNSQFIWVINSIPFFVHGFDIREIADVEFIGSGEASARAAFHVGASLERALDTAIKFNVYCDYPIQTLTLDRATGEIEERIYNQGDALP